MKIRSSVVLAFSALLASSALADKTSVYSFAGYSSYYQGDSSSLTGTEVSLSIDDHVDAFNFARTSAYASMGVLRSYASGRISTGGTPAPYLNFIGGNAGSSFETNVTPGGGVGAGTLETTVNVSGMLHAARIGELEYSYLEAWAGYEVELTLTPVGDPFSAQRRTMSGSKKAAGSFSGSTPGAFTPSFDIVFGTEYTLGVKLTAIASTMVPHSDPGAWTLVEAESDFAHTLTWGGASAYQGGSEVSGFSLYSDSGTDWSQPVPEPATMLALGAGLLPFLRRKRA